MKVATFLVGGLITILCFSTNKSKQYLLFLLSFYYIFNLGWIFYHWNGINLVDFPIIGLLLLGIFSNKKFKYQYPKLTSPIIGIIVWSVISALACLKFGWAMAELSKIVRAYLVFLCIANHVKTPKDLQMVMNGIICSLILESFMAIWQYKITPITPLAPFINEKFYPWRSNGTFFVPHYLGNYLVLLLPIVVRLALFYKPKDKKNIFTYGFYLGIGLIALVVSSCRGPWVGFAGSITLMMLFSLVKSRYRPKVKWASGLFVLGSCIVFIYFSDNIISRMNKSGKDASSQIRFDQWRIAIRLIKNRPLLGTGLGLGNYQLISPQYVYDYEKIDPRSWQFSEMVHNSYLFFAAQIGIPGLLMFFWSAILAFKLGFKVVKSRIPYFSNLAIGILTGFIGIGIAFFFGPDIHSWQLLAQIGLFGGILVALDQQEKLIRKKLIILQKERAVSIVKEENKQLNMNYQTRIN